MLPPKAWDDDPFDVIELFVKEELERRRAME